MAAPSPPQSNDSALSLTMAVMAASPTPLLLLDGQLTVLAVSASFCVTFQLDPLSVAGTDVFSLGQGEWDRPQLRALLQATSAGAGEVDAYEMDVVRPDQDLRNVLIQARRLDYLDLENIRVLVAVSDVTEARADARLKDEALAKHSVLLKEIRHRVANSLQIIASVLLQTARNTQSEESRAHLSDAHHRVMSVAGLERLLSASPPGDEEVRLHAYLRSLCASIGASMIADPKQITLTVSDGHDIVPARVSLSLGLIVTELVINALKHAFPDRRRGRVTVGYEGHGPNWILSVRDDGVGMPSDLAPTSAGLGTSIVESLAKQLRASVEIESTHAGTTVNVVHTQLALVVNATTGAADPAARPPWRSREAS
ncbi:MAG: histidine kinase dimerization/phosphoacceptor domain -containing protein [Hyphomonadaceae bacterium]|nr:histidine kinase dimerization/phosphoacceptor domain -containing protein [Hyphomonadaceae bacterium]